MKSLDTLLAQWVGEADESRADGAFRAYYSTAFPCLARHVQHRTGWDRAAAEDIAQEALLRFVERAGRGRREAAALVTSAAQHLTAPDPDAVRPRSTLRWANDVSAFTSSVTSFHLPSDSHWHLAAADLWAQIGSLRRRGWGLLDSAKSCVNWSLNEGRSWGDCTGSANHDEDGTSQIASSFARERPLDRWGTVLTGGGHACAERFIRTILTIVDTLPRLRLPTNGYLFEIATTLFLDEIKRRRRKKRGGTQCHAPAFETPPYRMADMSAHPFARAPDEPWLDRQPLPLDQKYAPVSGPLHTMDPVVRYESEEFFLRFYEYLRSPVARAVCSLEDARRRGRGLAEESRLESVSRKFSRMMTVLSLMGEGYTQEEAARRAGLSRNQVKYIVESVKEAYARFTAGQPRLPYRRVNREGESHAS